MNEESNFSVNDTVIVTFKIGPAILREKVYDRDDKIEVSPSNLIPPFVELAKIVKRLILHFSH